MYREEITAERSPILISRTRLGAAYLSMPFDRVKVYRENDQRSLIRVVPPDFRSLFWDWKFGGVFYILEKFVELS